MDDNNNDKDEKNTGAGASEHSAGAEGKIDYIDHADSLEEKEKTEEDAIATDRPSGETTGNTGSGQLKTPEDEEDNKDISDMQEEKAQDAQKDIIEEAADEINVHAHGDMQRKNEEATSLPPEGTIATIPEENSNSAHEDSAIADDGDDERSVVVPGFMFIAGPDYTGTGIHTGYVSGSDDGNINEGAVILQGFLPEDDPLRRRRSRAESTREQRTRERVQRLVDNAITLDDSAVRPIPIDEEGNNGSKSDSSGDDEEGKSDNPPWFLPLLVLVLVACVILAIVLPPSLRGELGNAAQDMSSPLSDAVCLPGEVEARLELAKSILSSITPPDLLEDGSTPQGKAIRWIVCNDSISVQLLGNQDSSTGSLPKQKHGFRFSGDAGEVQLNRRYILAAFFYSTSQVSPWTDTLNFLSPDLHECNWYRNYSRHNFPFGGKSLVNFASVHILCKLLLTLIQLHYFVHRV